MSTITVKDGTTIFYKDWGSGPVVTFSHGWPLCSDAWDGQMLFLAQNGFRVVAHDRRGHGRSSQAWSGNDMNGYADDLAALIEALDLTDVTMVGHSTGGGEVARYIRRHDSVSLYPELSFACLLSSLGLNRLGSEKLRRRACGFRRNTRDASRESQKSLERGGFGPPISFVGQERVVP
jgi:pimeloyl-ACP methyl ester carboxylesterase